MSRSIVAVIKSLVFGLCLNVHVHAAEPDVKTTNSELKFSAFVIPASHLPYQAVRTQVRLTNESDGPIGPLPPICMAVHASLKSPDGHDFRRVENVFLVRDLREPIPAAAGAPTVIRLNPKESDSISQACAAEWSFERGSFRDGRPLFPRAGTYELRHSYTVPRENEFRVLEANVLVRIAEPMGSDHTIYESLRKDAKLAEAMMSPVHASDLETTTKLRELVERFPTSSYADYARFALARSQVGGFGKWVRLRWGKLETKRGLARIEQWIIATEKPTSDKLCEFLKAIIPIPSYRTAHLTPFAETLISFKDAPERVRVEGVRKVYLEAVDLIRRDRARAIEDLEGIRTRPFPYRPYVLVLLKKLYVAQLLEQLEDDRGMEATFDFEAKGSLKGAARLESAGKLVRVVDELAFEFPDALVWTVDPAFVSSREWNTFKESYGISGR